jgi:hypothetical protein
MYSLLMLLLCAADTVLFLWVLRHCLRDGDAVLWTLAFILAALPYDTALVGLGRWIGPGETLAALSGPRFMLFNLSLPLLIVVSAGLARQAGVGWLQSRVAMGTACAVATAFIAWEWRGILTMPVTYPACWEDTLRYTLSVIPSQACTPGQAGVGVPGSLPKAGLLALPAVLVAGGLVWWRRRWPWLLAGSVVSFVFLGLPPSRVGPVPGFVGDALNMLGLAATAVRFRGRRAQNA